MVRSHSLERVWKRASFTNWNPSVYTEDYTWAKLPDTLYVHILLFTDLLSTCSLKSNKLVSKEK